MKNESKINRKNQPVLWRHHSGKCGRPRRAFVYCLGAMDILKRVSSETAPPKSTEAINAEVKSKFFLDSVLSKTENAAIIIPVNNIIY